MNKIGYALVDVRYQQIAARWHETTVDANGRPQMRFNVPGTKLDVHCPQAGDIYGENFKFVERYQDDPGAPSRWHSAVDAESFDGTKVVVTRVYAPQPDLVPDSVAMVKAKLTLLSAGFLDQVDATIAGLDRSDPSYRAIQIMWEYSLEVRRDSPELAMIAKLVGLGSQQIDDLFRAAAG